MSVAASSSVADDVAAHDWYHAIELPDGTVTPGWFDLRRVAPHVPFGDLRGRRCLDVGTFDGFWAFTMERLGAEEVVAVDVERLEDCDWPARTEPVAFEAMLGRWAGGAGFRLVHDLLGSSVRRVESTVYDLDPDVVGRFDLIYLGSILIHLRDPILAVERLVPLLAPGGRLVSLDSFDWALQLRAPRIPIARLDAEGRPWWWHANARGVQHILHSGGLDVERGRFVRMPAGPGQGPVPLRALRIREGRERWVSRQLGDPHVIHVGRPRAAA